MDRRRRILIVGGGTAGWLTAAYLAKSLRIAEQAHLEITLLESPDIGIIGVGEATFPTIRTTLQFLGIDESPVHPRDLGHLQAGHPLQRLGLGARGKAASATSYFHPFEAPFYDRRRQPGALLAAAGRSDARAPSPRP
jgi:tryptophan halogenase